MHNGFATLIQPMTIEAKRRALAIDQTDDVAKEMFDGVKVGSDDGGMISFHADIVGAVGECCS